ncbi:hypothetical protein BSKO_08065 [Bryopsis sp. KO-2023]|nr:hypothetical protein BSKO_08065 [Bryopsis sp. KO-2023]
MILRNSHQACRSTNEGRRLLSTLTSPRIPNKRLDAPRLSTKPRAGPGIESYDVAVVGVGGMGSAVCHHLTKAGCKVVGIENFDIAHGHGSSHGHTRLIRSAYQEDVEYVPLVRRAYQLWRDLEQEMEEELMILNGGLDVDGVFEGALLSAQTHGLEHEILTGKDVNLEYPGFSFPEDIPILFQPEGGFLLSERCIQAHCKAAKINGAELRIGERVIGWNTEGSGVEITTKKSRVFAQYLVITAGPWISQCVPEFEAILEVERQVVGWYGSKHPELFDFERFPIFASKDSTGMWYGVPNFEGRGLKLGKLNHLKEVVKPDSIDREVSEQDITCLREYLDNNIPEAYKTPNETSVCMFTNAPDENFIIDWHPRFPQVILCSACSGHGFKFSSAIGEMISNMVTNEQKQSTNMFKIDRESLEGKLVFPC